MTRQQLISIFFIVLLIYVIYQTILLFSPFFNAIVWAAILAYSFYPLYAHLRRGLGSRETVSALIMTVVIILFVIPPVIFLLFNLASQAIDLYQIVLSYIREGRLEALIDNARSLSIVKRLEADLFQWEPFKKNAADWVLTSTKNIANFTIAQAGTITKNLFSLLLSAILTCFLVFIFLKDGEKIYSFIYRIAPLHEENKRPIFAQITDTFSAVIRGQLLTSVTQSLVSGIIYWILQLPAPIFLAAATFIATLIPFVGAVAIWLPLGIYLFAVQDYWKATMLICFGILVISVIDNIMKPALIGEKTKLPYFLLFFAILGGLKIYGIMGIFLGPLVLSLFFVLVKIYQETFV